MVAFAALCFSLLAPWQLGKNSSTQHRNDLIKSAMATDAAPLHEVAPAGAPFVPDTEWREVTLTGRYLDDQQVLVRLRSAEERPAIEVLVPFAVDGGSRTVLVDRGYVRPDQNAIPSIEPAPSGETTISARIRRSEGTSPDRGAHREADTLAVYTIDPAEVSRATGLALDPFYLQLSPHQPGSLGEIAVPQLDSGPYLSYGLQWVAFGIMAPLGAAYFLYSEIRQRRLARAAAASDGGGGQAARAAAARPAESVRRKDRIRADLQRAGTATGARQRHQIGSGPGSGTATDDVRAKLADRYGD